MNHNSMRSIVKKEWNGFFSQGTGYFSIGLFLLFNSLILWVIRGSWNIFDTGIADLMNFFEVAPWLLLLLIPALSMRAFSEEYRYGTMELLLTRPLRTYEIAGGKFTAVLLIVLASLLPTLVYVFSISKLAYGGSPDMGSIAGSYLGLALLSAAFASVSIWAAAVTRTQISAFLTGLSLNFLLFWVPGQIVALYPGAPRFLMQLDLYTHYKSMGRGVLDTRDVLFMISVVLFFLLLTDLYLRENTRLWKKTGWAVGMAALLLVVNLVGQRLYRRFDLTADKRYTLSETSLNELARKEDKIFVKVFLKGDFPPGFERLGKEVRQHLEEWQAHSPRIHFRFISPVGREKELIEKGMEPVRLTVEEKTGYSEKIIFPWAEISTGGKSVPVNLLPATDMDTEEQLETAAANMEYAFTKALHRLQRDKYPHIAILKGNGETENVRLLDFLSAVKQSARLSPFSIEKAGEHPLETMREISKFDLLIIAKPRIAFSESQKYLLDRYITGGGKTLWLLDYHTASMDSLRPTGKSVVIARDLNLTDLLFSYGVRINHDIIRDAYSAPIALASGDINGQAQYRTYPWTYFPLVRGNPKHPVSKNLKPIRLKFPSSMDTLRNSVRKSILLASSPMTKKVGLPAEVELSSVAVKPDPDSFRSGVRWFGVLLEGKFTSAYTYKTKPFDAPAVNVRDSKMIVISDGDIIENELKNGYPVPMDNDPWTGLQYGNKAFLLNAVDYLLDDTGIMELRTNTRNDIPLDKEEIAKNKTLWQFVNTAIPLLILGLYGLISRLFRRYQYGLPDKG